MISYRDYLDKQGVPPGPWVTRDSDGSPEGEKPQALSAKHDSAGRRHRPRPLPKSLALKETGNG